MLAIDDANLQLEIATRLAGAEEVRERIDSLLTHSTIPGKSVIYQKKSRVKLAKSIFDKIQDRRRKLPERGYGIGDVGDVVGFRLITLYDECLFDLFQELTRLIEQGQSVANPIFKRVTHNGGASSLPDTFNDCCVFAQTDAKANPYIQCHARIKEKFSLKNDTLVRLEIRENGYSSIHVQLDGLIYRDHATRSVPVEFQLRTALEDTWAEISHELEYKKRYDQLSSREDWRTIIENASVQLRTFKSAIDEATRQATAIRQVYNRIDKAIDPVRRDREFIIERPIALLLIESRYGLPVSPAIAKAADDLHVLLNRLVVIRRMVETEGNPLAPTEPVKLPALKAKLAQDARLRDGKRIIHELEEAFEDEIVHADRRATIRLVLELEGHLLCIRVLVCRIAQLRYEQAPTEVIDREIEALKDQCRILKESAQRDDPPFRLVGAAVRAFAAGAIKDETSRAACTAEAFEIALKAHAPEITKVAQTTICLNALAHHLAERGAQGEKVRKKSAADFVRLTTGILDDSMLVLTRFYDPSITYALYIENIITLCNNVLMSVVELYDAGVESKEIAQHITSQQISNVTEMMGKADTDPEYRGHRLHTLCGVYRVLKRPEQWKRTVRELREHVQRKGKALKAELRVAYEAELAKPFPGDA